MPGVVDILEERVQAAAELIAGLRAKVQSLERELRERDAVEAAASCPPPVEPAPAEELERLRAERAVIRETVRGLIREIDRVSW